MDISYRGSSVSDGLIIAKMCSINFCWLNVRVDMAFWIRSLDLRTMVWLPRPLYVATGASTWALAGSFFGGRPGDFFGPRIGALGYSESMGELVLSLGTMA